MSQNQGMLKLHVLDNLQSRKCLSETHLCVPEHLVAFLKLLLGLVDGFLLFGRNTIGEYSRVTSADERELRPSLTAAMARLTVSRSVMNHSLALLTVSKTFFLIPEPFQNIMYFLVVE